MARKDDGAVAREICDWALEALEIQRKAARAGTIKSEGVLARSTWVFEGSPGAPDICRARARSVLASLMTAEWPLDADTEVQFGVREAHAPDKVTFELSLYRV